MSVSPGDTIQPRMSSLVDPREYVNRHPSSPRFLATDGNGSVQQQPVIEVRDVNYVVPARGPNWSSTRHDESSRPTRLSGSPARTALRSIVNVNLGWSEAGPEVTWGLK